MRIALVILASHGSYAVTPIQKVVQLLDGMAAQGKQEKHEEEKQFATYKQWCTDTGRAKQRAIEQASRRIDSLNAAIEKHTADARQLGLAVAAHDGDIAVWEGDQRAATKVRTIEKADFDALHKDYSESIDALERAVQVLKKQNHQKRWGSISQALGRKREGVDLGLTLPELGQRDRFIAPSPAEPPGWVNLKNRCASKEIPSH